MIFSSEATFKKNRVGLSVRNAMGKMWFSRPLLKIVEKISMTYDYAYLIYTLFCPSGCFVIFFLLSFFVPYKQTKVLKWEREAQPPSRHLDMFNYDLYLLDNDYFLFPDDRYYISLNFLKLYFLFPLFLKIKK